MHRIVIKYLPLPRLDDIVLLQAGGGDRSTGGARFIQLAIGRQYHAHDVSSDARVTVLILSVLILINIEGKLLVKSLY